jgi:isopenicillin N synthase-like dioxygenase/tRNA(Arg) A34 adenosine deaminase TadA
MPARDHDKVCIMAAIEQSHLAVVDGCMPFGAVLVDDDGKVLLEARNGSAAAKKRGGTGDVTRHAEMELVRKASAELSLEERSKCTVYTSTEPCVMCAGAIYWGGFCRVVYGCSSLQLEQELSGPGGFDIDIRKLYGDYARPGAREMEVEGPLLEDKAMLVHAEAGIWGKSEEYLKEKKSSADQQDIAVERSLLETGLGAAPAVDDGTVPIIDLSSGSEDEIAARLWEAATTVGFFTVVGHGIPQDVIKGAFDTSASFFSQPVEAKHKQSPFAANLNSGYEFMSQVRPSTGLADQKESLQITSRNGSMDGRWPSGEFQKGTSALMEAAHGLAGRILDLLEPKAVPHMKEKGGLSKSHTLWADDGQCTLRLLHYPPVPKETITKLREAGYWRAGAHTDWDNITLLFQTMDGGGLECCANPRVVNENQYWTKVNPVEGGIAVNIGDMLSRWSDGRLLSNLHRVRLPNDEEMNPPRSRYSIAYFAQSDKKTLIESASAEAITAGDYIMSRVRSNFEADFKK